MINIIGDVGALVTLFPTESYRFWPKANFGNIDATTRNLRDDQRDGSHRLDIKRHKAGRVTSAVA